MALEGLGYAQDTYGWFLGEIILLKVPNSLKNNWCRRQEDMSLNIDQLLAFLKTEAKAIECVEPSEKSVVTHKLTHDKINRISKSKSCFLCKEDHYLLDCPRFLECEPRKRIDIARQNKLCFNCLGKHMVPECTRRSNCKQCESKHHSLLHCRM